MADPSKKLKKIRGGHVSQITVLLREPDHQILISNIPLIQDQLAKIEVLDSQVLDTLEDSEFDNFLAESIQYQITIKRDINVILNKNFVANNDGQSVPDKVKLPKIDIPYFDGDYATFYTFWDVFETCIDGNSTLSNVSKLSYLRSYLKGNALSAINGLQLTNANYQEAVKILKSRFGDKDRVSSALINKLLNIQSVSNDVSKLRIFHDQVESCTRNLATIGIAPDGYEIVLLNLMRNKLPNEFLIAMEHKNNDHKWTLDSFMDCFRGILAIREKYNDSTQSCSNSRAKPNVYESHSNSAQSSVSALVNQGNVLYCKYCRGSHKTHKCPKSLDEKYAIICKERLCFKCLGKRCNVRTCQATFTCYFCKGKNHHSTICRKQLGHYNNKVKVNVMTESDMKDEDREQHTKETTTVCVSDHSLVSNQASSVLLQTAKVKVSDIHGKVSLNVRLLFDKGSTKSFVTSKLAFRLNLKPIHTMSLCINTFGSVATLEKRCDVVKIQLSGRNDVKYCCDFCVVESLCSPLQQPVSIQSNLSEFSNLVLADPDIIKEGIHQVDILIGCDMYWDLVKDCIIRSPSSNLVAMESMFGYLLSGKYNIDQPSANSVENCYFNYTKTNSLNSVLRDFWELEAIGIQTPSSDENTDVLHYFEQHVNKREGEPGYVVKFPYRGKNINNLSDNYEACVKQLKSLHKKLSRDGELLDKYDCIIQKQKLDHIIEKPPDVNQHSIPLHYLPHHAVITPQKTTTKVRIVFNGSYKAFKGALSLNDCLCQGPNLLEDLLHIILRFRLQNVVLISDIEQAYLKIGLDVEDRDATRFIWLKDYKLPPSEDNLEILRFATVLFGLNVSQFLLTATLQHHLMSYQYTDPDVIVKLMKSFYVDDMNCGMDTIEEGQVMYQKAKCILGEGNFNLRKWSSNKGELRELFYSNSDHVSGCELKVLGLLWNNEVDILKFNMSKLKECALKLPVTKRSILKIIGQMYDPIGLLCGFIIRGKIMFQLLCLSKCSWDGTVDDNIKELWLKFIKEIDVISMMEIPRQYFTCYKTGESIAIYSFCDASQKAYAAMVYLKQCSTGQVSLVMAKSCVAPCKNYSIPRLELLGATLAARLVHTVKAAFASHNITQVRCYSDSKNVLYWLHNNEKDWKLFVRNRVDEILTNTDADMWDYVNTDENPADLPSRGCKASSLTSELYMHGPKWLKDVSIKPVKFNIKEEVLGKVELKSDYVFQAVYDYVPEDVCLELNVQPKNEMYNAEHNFVQPIFDSGKYSSFMFLIRVTMMIFKRVAKLKYKISILTPEGFDVWMSQLRDKAETYWMCYIQAKHFGKELKYLLNPSKHNKTNLVKNLNLFLYEGVIRCKGRLEFADLGYGVKYPILLPNNDFIVTMLIRKCHTDVLHSGVRDTLNHLRLSYWVIRGRQAVRRVVRACVTCRKVSGRSYPVPESPPLPSSRVTFSRPFSTVGLDFAGPLMVKTSKEGECGKAYILLLTCGSIRALHIELVSSMSAQSFLNAFIRFKNRRGIPRTIISDNAKTFKRSAQEVSEFLDSKDLSSFISSNSIDWRFIVEKSPWWGGFYERLVRSIKQSLKKVVGRAFLSLEELTTVLTDVEAVLNSRPLTYLYTEDLESPITLSHFLLGGPIFSNPGKVSITCTEGKDMLIKRLKFVEATRKAFWSRWYKFYLIELREHTRSFQKPNYNLDPKSGDIVLLEDHLTGRVNWKLAKILETFKGRDGKVRSVSVSCMSNDKMITLKRPIQTLFPLEVNTLS